MRLILTLMISLALFPGCGNTHKPNPTPPDSVILYAIDGAEDEPTITGLPPDQILHGYPILGQVDLTGTDTGKQLADLIELQQYESSGSMYKCFWPRHALRVVRGGITTDYIICFECRQYEWYSKLSDQKIDTHYIPESHRDAFTAVRGFASLNPSHHQPQLFAKARGRYLLR